MPQPTSPREVFATLLAGVTERRWDDLPRLYAERTHVVHPLAPLPIAPLRSRDDVRAHFARAAAAPGPPIRMRAADVAIHDTTDPEVIVAEFAYEGTVPDTGATFRVPCVFVLRVRDGEIVESHDYIDHLAFARARGDLADLFAALQARAADGVDVQSAA